MESSAVVIILMFPTFTGGIAISPSYPIKLSPGIYLEELKGPTFYESYLPLMYEYEVPTYTTLDITLADWRDKCLSDDIEYYSCPVFFHFERYLEYFENEVVPKPWVDITTNKTTSPSKLVKTTDFCNKIQGHFEGGLISEFVFQEYIQKIYHCLKTPEEGIEIIQDYVFSIKPLFKKMDENYENEFSEKFTGLAKQAFYVNALTSNQNGMLIAYLLEKLRWTDAVSSCKNKHAPEMLLRPQTVTKSIKDLNKRLALSNKMTSIDTDQLTMIFKLPLTDCTFIETSGNFFVRLLIPIINKYMNPGLYTISTFPFLIENKLCQLILNTGTGKFLYDKGGNNLFYSNCLESDAFCQVNQMNGIVSDLCLRAAFNEDLNSVKIYCRSNLRCADLPNRTDLLNKPIVQQIGSDTWAFIGTGINDAAGIIRCEGTSQEVKVDLGQKVTGALQIKLPCRCNMVYNTQQLIPGSPCSEEANKLPEINQILLPHFLHEDVNVTNPLNITSDSFDFNVDDYSSQTQQLRDGHVHTDSIGSQLVVLWTIVILQLICMVSLTSFGLNRYGRFKRQMRYSKERLVYNVYPSDSNLHESNVSPPAYRTTTTSSADSI